MFLTLVVRGVLVLASCVSGTEGERADCDADGGVIIVKLSVDLLDTKLDMDLVVFVGDDGRDFVGDTARDVSEDVNGRTGEMARAEVVRGERIEVVTGESRDEGMTPAMEGMVVDRAYDDET